MGDALAAHSLLQYSESPEADYLQAVGKCRAIICGPEPEAGSEDGDGKGVNEETEREFKIKLSFR